MDSSASNNAGIFHESDPFWDEVAFQPTIDTNLIGTMVGIKYQISAMSARGGGSIVTISSVQGLVGTGNPPPASL